MPDPITALGAAAGAVQLADVALRLSKEAYQFLSQVKNAKRDVEELKETLADVDANARNLRNYVDAVSRSKMATEEFEVLSPVIVASIKHFHDDISLLKSLIPDSASLRTAQRCQWAFNRRSVQNITKRMASRKANLSIALTTIGRFHDLRLRQDVADLRQRIKFEADATIQSLITSHEETTSRFLNLSDQLTDQAHENSHFLDVVRQTHSEVVDIHAHFKRHHDEAHSHLINKIAGLTGQIISSADQHN